MGTHPIFESDFDCLTELSKKRNMAESEFAEIRDFHKRISAEAEHLIKKEFPSKVKKLDERAGSEKWALARLADIHAESKKSTGSDKVVTGVKRKRGDNGDAPVNGGVEVPEFPCNKWIVELVDDIKPDISTLMERCATIRIWITLLIPKIEDGNNFGVGVQEDALGELRQVEAECATYLDQLSRYFLTRGNDFKSHQVPVNQRLSALHRGARLEA